MTKKLNLSDFLKDYPSISKDNPFLIAAEVPLTYPLTEFYNAIVQHNTGFCINNVYYTSIIPSKNNLYFFNEGSNEEFILIFDPIIDIKQRNGMFNVFYYPDKVITIELKESNVKESQKIT